MSQTRVSVIVAHPDDEVLGFGGAIARHADRGDEVSILILATGLAARSETDAPETTALSTLREQAEAAADILGAVHLIFGEFADNKMDAVPLLEVVKQVEHFLSDRTPTILYTHYGGDLNIDHQIVSRAAITACRPIPGAKVTEILAGEVNSTTEWALPGHGFCPTDFLDISEVLDRKVRALECYAGELRDWPHPRSAKGIETQAQWRGMQSGLDAAEAYQLVRRIRF